ncbi:MAG: C4-dicarboxylate transporter DcuC [Bacteroidota bacterium]|nr:C4-dicarboxylate transporter DcuC [Candidatus Kapabacteria bacterium]MCS7302833.1 C4-dicarboxylate transporter DcuC [Candidatus Kapabacteria bacterium]MDW8075627.1 C4-dicarboxylate transporter DcuC [Bacteroidota bacterium]MDW8272130.1 C4-dicarboxylate transporter DcuC [Bacteroidota bacterium]
MDWQLGVALGVSAAALVLVWRGVDVRVVLIAAGIVLAFLGGVPQVVLDAFLRVMGDGSIVGPICSAMGYAYVLRALGADRALVELLVAPLQRVRWLLVPGGCVAGFIVNMAITSQTAAAAAVGPILLPLLRSAGYDALASAAVLVVGCSTGGNLFNPGEPDIVTISAATGAPVHHAIGAVMVPHVVGFAAAVVVTTILAARRRGIATSAVECSQHRPRLFLALLPPLPIALLLLLMPQWNLVPAVTELYPTGVPVTHVMVPCAVLAIVVHWRRASELARSFFEGLGYGFAAVISIIIAAACFLEGLKVMGAIEHLVALLSGVGDAAPIVAILVTVLLAVISGSGTAPSVTFSKAVLPSLVQTGGLDTAVQLGALGAIGASLGRTMSPLAAVVIFSATLAEVSPRHVVRRTAPAMVAAGIAAIVAHYLWVYL